MTSKPVDLHHEDFDDSDRTLVWMAGAHLVLGLIPVGDVEAVTGHSSWG
jgi:hypothetical protein